MCNERVYGTKDSNCTWSKCWENIGQMIGFLFASQKPLMNIDRHHRHRHRHRRRRRLIHTSSHEFRAIVYARFAQSNQLKIAKYRSLNLSYVYTLNQINSGNRICFACSPFFHSFARKNGMMVKNSTFSTKRFIFFEMYMFSFFFPLSEWT